MPALQPLIDKVWRLCKNTGNWGRTITLKIKFADSEIITPSRSLTTIVDSRYDLERVAFGLLEGETPFREAVRLLRVSLSSLRNEQAEVPQLDLPI